MVSALISRVMVLGVGTLFPAYRSYKAVRTKDVREYVKWMMYWIVFALFLCAETFLDLLVAFWLPFYYELKILFVVWLLSPYTKGASVLYRKFIHPTLNEHEDQIDLYLDQAKNSTTATILKLGSQGVGYAKEVVANAAMAGQAGLMAQVRKSYSLNDLSQDAGDQPAVGPIIQEVIEEDDDDAEGGGGGGDFVGYYENGRLVERRVAAKDRDKDRDADEDFEELGVEDVAAAVQPRRQGLRPRKQNHNYSEEEKYATLPRNFASSVGGGPRK